MLNKKTKNKEVDKKKETGKKIEVVEDSPKKKFFGPEQRRFTIWTTTSFFTSIIICASLVFFGVQAYHKTIDVIDESAKNMIEKYGIEVTAELNKQQLEIARQILEKKHFTFLLPNAVRNIFQFDSYVHLKNDNQLPMVSTSTSDATTSVEAVDMLDLETEEITDAMDLIE